jgi:putative tricarboxylic transport membrane protein
MVVLIFTGAYLSQRRISDVLLALCFGVLGYYLKKGDWSRVALVIAFVLGPHLERYFHLTMRLMQLGRIDFASRPALFVLCGLIIISVLGVIFRSRKEETG